MSKLTFIQDVFSPKGIISTPLVIGVFLVLIGTLLAIASPVAHEYGEIYSTFLTIGLTASGLGAGENLIHKKMDSQQ